MRVTVRLGDYLWRPLTGGDGDTAFVLSLRNSERFRRMFYQSTLTPQMHQQFIVRGEERDEINWLVEHSQKPAAVASIYNIDLANRKCECGRIAMLEPRLFFMSWIVSGMVTFDVIGLNRAYIETLEQNETIARGVESMGMTREGLLRGHIFRDGKPLNVLLYAITADEWQARRDEHYLRWGKPELVSFEGQKVGA